MSISIKLEKEINNEVLNEYKSKLNFINNMMSSLSYKIGISNLSTEDLRKFSDIFQLTIKVSKVINSLFNNSSKHIKKIPTFNRYLSSSLEQAYTSMKYLVEKYAINA
ncbi:hypothetical protein [Clostridium tarantellae]|uniref:Uncharacterized protein n=1 Tax=Clostridium tarantellae TaxID=39493 RepID=A0A6I1MMK3_9CLOT|nr:hypothetical protein [Clostridium tarantellae]MPQ43993.1 hypothetical protein [Clostridium tarantellae]